MRNRRISDTRSSTWIVRERSWSSMAAWWKRPSAWAISIDGGPLVLDGLDQEAGLVVPDPLLDAGEDLVGGEVLGGDAEDLVGDLHQRVDARAARRAGSRLRPPRARRRAAR